MNADTAQALKIVAQSLGLTAAEYIDLLIADDLEKDLPAAKKILEAQDGMISRIKKKRKRSGG